MSDSPTTRSSLLFRIRDGQDHEAWTRFVDLYGPLIYGFARSHGFQDADAADLMQEVLRAVVDHLMTQERPPTREVLLNDLLSLMACHSAVRAGDRLTQEQMAALIEQRHLADDPHHCPHGRPTALLFSRHDLERQFGRV